MTRIVDLPPRNAIEAEASAWIVQLDGRAPSKADLAALREWARRSPKHLETIRRLAELWGQLDVLTDLATVRAAPVAHRRPAPWRLASAAALVAAAVVTASFFLWFSTQPDLIERGIHATAVGEQERLALSDGSQVSVNTDSIIEVDFDAAERRIRLVRGEALFDVAHDPERPFVVYAGRSAVRALGTAFSVRIKADALEVRVTMGRVELVQDASAMGASGPNAPGPDAPEVGVQINVQTIEASQTALLASDGPQIETVDEAELDRLLAWRDGMLAFEGETLSEVVEEVSRYTPTRIEIDDPELRDLNIGGYFRIGETEALLEALETGFGVQVTRDGVDVVRLSMAEPR